MNIALTLATNAAKKKAQKIRESDGSLTIPPPEQRQGTRHNPAFHYVFAKLMGSGLFDAEYYRSAGQYLEGDEAILLAHFLNTGCTENRRPNPYFEPAWYLQAYPEVAMAGTQPLLHYVMHGDFENRAPGPLFNTAWYRQTYAVPAEELALAHYLARRREGTVSPIPEFDMAYYAKNNPDVIAAKIDPFEHFIAYGYKEGRNPSADFDVNWYAGRYISGNLDQNPFFHWLSHHGQPGVYGRLPDDEPTVAREVRRYCRPAPDFEEVRALPKTAVRHAKVLAYYLPQFHAFRENDEWWGKGFTEWTNIARGMPRYRGHYQPRIPRDLGFYSLDAQSIGATLARQVQLARGGGVHGFVFYHYWFNRKRLMDGPIDYLLRHPEIDMPFALMWANENWTRAWDGAASEVLIAQDYRPGDDETMLADFQRYFRDPRYIRLEGRPLFMLYRPGIVPQSRDAIARWREIWRSNWREDPIIVMAQAFGDNDPRAFGLDGAVEFPPHKLTQHMLPINNTLQMLDPEFKGKVYDYDVVVRQSLDEEEPPFRLIKTAVPSWDNDARRQGTGLSIARSTPAKYEAWLGKLVERAERKLFFGEPIVCINAWNEWCEGTYLEPDVHFGAAYLNATGRAVVRGGGLAAGTPGQMLLVGHDAFPGGAQQLLLKIGQSLRALHGVRLEFLLLDGGKLENEYKATAPTTVLGAPAGMASAIAEFVGRGFTHAMVNTSASGAAVTALTAAGVHSVLLIHELPRLLREKHLLKVAADALKTTRLAVFPAEFVRDAVLTELGLRPDDVVETVIMPQGSYKSIERSDEAAALFRRSIEASDLEPIVLGVGYADLRKGFDIFLQLWRLLNRDTRAHFCWLGGIDPDLKRWLGEEIVVAERTGTFHMMGLVSDVVPAFSAARAFALTSREDPFPTVALEALEAGMPVIAFDGSGGIPELLTKEQVGESVAYGDITAMAEALRRALEEGPGDAPARRRALIRGRFLFSDYVSRLMAATLPTLPRVSVSVPNYNYARYMPERLGSVFGQSHPVHEILVLDDFSTDDSLTVIPAIAKDWNREIRLIPNLGPSGSVFAQWRKAAELATGEWLWIAEADDGSSPDFLTRLLAVVDSDPRVVLAFSDSRTIHADGTPQWDNYKSYYASVEPGALTQSQVFDGDEFVARFMSVKNLILNASAVLWRREALLAALDGVGEDLYSYKVAGDWCLYLQAMATPGARIAYESNSLNVHRRHAESVTHKLNIDKHLDEIRRCHARACAMVPGGSADLNALQARYLRETAEYLGGLAGPTKAKTTKTTKTKTSEPSANPAPP